MLFANGRFRRQSRSRARGHPFELGSEGSLGLHSEVATLPLSYRARLHGTAFFNRLDPALVERLQLLIRSADRPQSGPARRRATGSDPRAVQRLPRPPTSSTTRQSGDRVEGENRTGPVPSATSHGGTETARRSLRSRDKVPPSIGAHDLRADPESGVTIRSAVSWKPFSPLAESGCGQRYGHASS